MAEEFHITLLHICSRFITGSVDICAFEFVAKARSTSLLGNFPEESLENTDRRYPSASLAGSDLDVVIAVGWHSCRF